MKNDHDPLDLSRILHELAGAAAMCWHTRPVGTFDSEKARACVEYALADIRVRIPAQAPALRLPEPMTDEAIYDNDAIMAANSLAGLLFGDFATVVRAIETEVLRRVRECNDTPTPPVQQDSGAHNE